MPEIYYIDTIVSDLSVHGQNFHRFQSYTSELRHGFLFEIEKNKKKKKQINKKRVEVNCGGWLNVCPFVGVVVVVVVVVVIFGKI